MIWLARQGWQVTGADFAANGLARAAAHAAEALQKQVLRIAERRGRLGIACRYISDVELCQSTGATP